MPAPEQHVRESWGAAEFYSNKLLMQYRGQDEAQVTWLKAFKVHGKAANQLKPGFLLKGTLGVRPAAAVI